MSFIVNVIFSRLIFASFSQNSLNMHSVMSGENKFCLCTLLSMGSIFYQSVSRSVYGLTYGGDPIKNGTF